MNNSTNSRNFEEIEQIYNKLKKDYSNIIFKKMSLLNIDKEEDISTLILEINRSLDNQEDNINSEVIDSIKFKYPFAKKKNNNKDIINIALLGKSTTGKTSFIFNLEEKIVDSISVTIGQEVFNMFGEIFNEELNITFIDTSGQERFRSLIQNHCNFSFVLY